MTHDAPTPSAAVPVPPAGGIAEAEAALPTIDRWGVVGHDRIVGILRDSSSPRNGKKIITSPVVRMRVAEGGEHVAQTQSGTRYVLASAAAGFGTERALEFVRHKCSVPSSQDLPPPNPELESGLLKLAS